MRFSVTGLTIVFELLWSDLKDNLNEMESGLKKR